MTAAPSTSARCPLPRAPRPDASITARPHLGRLSRVPSSSLGGSTSTSFRLPFERSDSLATATTATRSTGAARSSLSNAAAMWSTDEQQHSAATVDGAASLRGSGAHWRPGTSDRRMPPHVPASRAVRVVGPQTGASLPAPTRLPPPRYPTSPLPLPQFEVSISTTTPTTTTSAPGKASSQRHNHRGLERFFDTHHSFDTEGFSSSSSSSTLTFSPPSSLIEMHGDDAPVFTTAVVRRTISRVDALKRLDALRQRGVLPAASAPL